MRSKYPQKKRDRLKRTRKLLGRRQRARCLTAERQSLFHLSFGDGGWVPPLVALHILPPENGHVVLQFKHLHHIQVSGLVRLKVLVKELKARHSTPRRFRYSRRKNHRWSIASSGFRTSSVPFCFQTCVQM